MRPSAILWTVFVAFFLAGCETTNERLLDTNQNQLSLRQVQTRAFDTNDKEFVLVSTITTLQDLGFVIDGADDVLGTVTATKLDQYALKITVTVRPRGDTQMLVRANAQYQLKPVTEPEPYQDFFSALSKDMFLEEHQIE